MTTESLSNRPTASLHAGRLALLWLGPLAVMLGIVMHGTWRQWHSGRTAELLLIAVVFAGTALLTRKLTRWSATTVLAGLWCVLLPVFVGVAPVLATLLFAMAAIACGARILPRENPALQALLGAALLSAIAGWLLPLPVHHGWIYLLACLITVLLGWRGLWQSVACIRPQWNQAVQAAPRTSFLAVLCMGLASTVCWLPSVQFDDLAYHLRLPWQLQQQGFYSLDPQHQIWALAPWAADVIQAIPQLMAGQEARGGINALWMLTAAAGVCRLTRQLGGTALAGWMSMALFASLPLTAVLAGNMHTELPMTAVLLWLAVLVTAPLTEPTRSWLAISMLVGLLAAIKLTAALIAGPWLLLALFRQPWPSAPRMLWVVMLAFAIGCSSYVYAWFIAGNPFLPLFNGWFHSAYVPAANFVDARWLTGFNVFLPWNMTFDTGRFLEAFSGGGGFLLTGFTGVWIFSLFYKPTRLLGLLATLSFLLPLSQLQYLRYAYPAMVLLCPVWAVAALHLDRRHAIRVMAVLCVLNLGFQANGHWMLRTGALKITITALGQDDALLKKFAPERLLARAIRKDRTATGNVLVLDASRPYYAEFDRDGRSPTGYSPAFQSLAAIANQDPTGHTWKTLLEDQAIQQIILLPESLLPAQRAALELSGARHRMTIEDAQWWTLPRQPGQPE